VTALKRPLLPWQAPAVAGAAVLLRQHGGCLLEMGMSTGKTMTACALFSGATNPVLVLCPKAVLGVWPREIEANLNGWRCYRLEGSTADRKLKTLRAALLHPEKLVACVNYEALRSPKILNELLAHRWSFLVCDESHKIKSPRGLDSRNVRQVAEQANYKLCLTGTPMPHSPGDIWAQAAVFADGLFPGYQTFQAKYTVRRKADFGHKTKTGKPMLTEIVESWRNLDDLHHRLDARRIKLTRDQADLGLHDITHYNIDVPLEDEQRKAYASMHQHRVVLTEQALGGTVTAANVLSQLIRLQQLTSGVLGGIDELDPSVTEIIGDAKQQALQDIIEQALEITEGKPTSHSPTVVVFARFTHSLNVAEQVAHNLGLTYSELSGRRRDGLTTDSKLNTTTNVVGVNYQSGGAGVDFSATNLVVCYDQTWSLGDFDQAMARCHRTGQTKPVHVWHLLASVNNQPTIDGDIRETVNNRRDFIKAVSAGEFDHKEYKLK
jgi:SNF2 family DNA or RNA helicase